MESTYQVKSAYVRKSDIIKALKSNTLKKAQEIAASFAEMLQLLEQEKGERIVEMEKPHLWFDKDVAALWPYEVYSWTINNRNVYKTMNHDDRYYTYYDLLGELKVASVGNDALLFDIPTIQEMKSTFSKDVNIPLGRSGEEFLEVDGVKYYSLFAQDGNWINFFARRQNVENGGRSSYEYVTIGGNSNNYGYFSSPTFYTVRIHRLKKKNAESLTFSESVKFWLELGLLPEKLKRRTKQLYKGFMDSYAILGQYIDFDDDRKLVFDTDKFVQDVAKGVFINTVFDYDFNFAQMEKEVLAGKRKITDLSEVKKQLLACDKKRANLRVYPDKRLTDQGHWDLCEEPQHKEDYALVQIDNTELLLARPPQLDVKPNKVCGIDFGTKSTVVAVYENDEYLLRVGQPDLSKNEVANDYENPTIIECRDVEAFMKEYQAKAGRPYTEWEQLTVAHTAKEALEATNSDVSKCIFADLKQWTHDGSKRYVRDRKGHVTDIKPFLDLQDGDFNPLEIYAYYLGLYINNMEQGICLEYVMSFPVNFEVNVRENILRSFDRGLNKSLPVTLKQKVHIYEGASEPAAYAITALKELQLQPKNKDQQCAYGVFDFGGGTTDFDFGIENIMVPKRGKPYIEIHQLGNGGNPYLGGENILELLSYQVYQDNFAKMKEKQIPFILPALGTGVAFSGAELFVKHQKDASQAAYLNCKHLAEALRDIWERKEGYQNKYKNNPLQLIMYSDINTFTQEGEIDSYSRELTVNVPKLEKLIYQVVENGVVNFFAKCRQSFANYGSVALPIHILLAGNSSKSPVVEDLFSQYMEKETLYIKSVRKNCEVCFELHLPLGTELVTNTEPVGVNLEQQHKVNEATQESKDKDKEGGIKPLMLKPLGMHVPIKDSDVDVSESNFKYTKTGKTGVAFGLLQSRSGARKYTIINEIADGNNPQFKYYIGSCDLDDNFQVDIMLDDGRDRWVEFLPADEQYFDLYYTSEAKSVNGNMPIKETQHAYLQIDGEAVTGDEDTNIYLRKVDSETIEYVVCTNKEISNFDEIKQSKKIYKYKL